MRSFAFKSAPRILLVPTFCLASGFASAQPIDTVTVNGSALVGVWKITRPEYVAKESFFGALEWGPMHDTYCRFEQVAGDLIGHCFPGSPPWMTTIAGAHIHMAFGTMMARFVIDGALQSPTHFTGTDTIKLSGISFDNPTPSDGAKMTISEAAPDKGGESALLRAILTAGLASVPHDDTAMKKITRLSEVPQLGPIQAIAYLGQMAKPQPPNAKDADHDFFSVYAVEYDNAERVCGLHQRADGVLDAFACV